MVGVPVGWESPRRRKCPAGEREERETERREKRARSPSSSLDARRSANDFFVCFFRDEEENLNPLLWIHHRCSFSISLSLLTLSLSLSLCCFVLFKVFLSTYLFPSLSVKKKGAHSTHQGRRGTQKHSSLSDVRRRRRLHQQLVRRGPPLRRQQARHGRLDQPVDDVHERDQVGREPPRAPPLLGGRLLEDLGDVDGRVARPVPPPQLEGERAVGEGRDPGPGEEEEDRRGRLGGVLGDLRRWRGSRGRVGGDEERVGVSARKRERGGRKEVEAMEKRDEND